METILDLAALVGRRVLLEPLAVAHVDPLVRAAEQDGSGYKYTTVPPDQEGMTEYVRTLVAARSLGEVLPFAQVRVTDNVAVGVTSYLTLRARPGALAPYAVEIGNTWLAAAAQGTGINAEAKLLLLTHAFEVWGVGRVDFKTDARNGRSRAALAALGAKFEGVLRCWQPSRVANEEMSLRDSAMYSVLNIEWADVRQGILERLQ